MKLLASWTLAVCIALPTISQAQAPPAKEKDKLPPPQVLPQPKELPPLPLLSIRIVPGPQLGQRAIWELYSVDYRGRMVPRVVADPRGAYYLSDGRPYPWTTLDQGPYMVYPTD